MVVGSTRVVLTAMGEAVVEEGGEGVEPQEEARDPPDDCESFKFGNKLRADGNWAYRNSQQYERRSGWERGKLKFK
jgi:hypothetical protein